MLTDLTKGVEQALYELDPKQAEQWRQDVARHNYDKYPPMTQVQLLNSYWSHRLAMCHPSTFNARCALRPDLSPEHWIQVFTRYVLPSIPLCGAYHAA